MSERTPEEIAKEIVINWMKNNRVVSETWLFNEIAQAIRDAEVRGLNKAREALELVSKMERE